MKFGYRKPSIKKSIKAKTTGKIKRQAKRTINPTYGKKGMGWVNNPKKTIYNKVYNKTTVDIRDTLKNNANRNTNNIKTNDLVHGTVQKDNNEVYYSEIQRTSIEIPLALYNFLKFIIYFVLIVIGITALFIIVAFCMAIIDVFISIIK